MPLSTRHTSASKMATFIVLLSALASNATLHADYPEPIILQLTGELGGADHESYREVPFTVPAGVSRITVEVEYDREDRTVVDLGLFDPERFRGWSGGNKAQFTLTESDATPSYLPGPLPPGEWRLILGVPNIRPDSLANFTADITLESGPAALTRGFAATALVDEPGWYRGELHAHTGHSDGSCLSQSGQIVPCPVYRTVARAGELGMDFIAVTEHNATSHHQSLHELQLAFDRTVLISGREITTFYGHANIFGTTAFIDFRSQNNDLDPVLEQARAAGAFISINHPGLPSGETCMGCGWTALTDFSVVDAVEVINGSVLDADDGDLRGRFSAIPFWEDLLNQGYRVAAIAGSDNHNADLRAFSNRLSSLGEVTTVIQAESLSQTALLDGLRNGRAFIDLQGSNDRVLDLLARSGGNEARMGGVLEVSAGAPVTLEVVVSHVPDANIDLYLNGVAADIEPVGLAENGQELTFEFELPVTSETRWVRAEVRSSQGTVLLLSNPVYLHHPSADLR